MEARPSGELDMELELEHKLELVMVEKFCNVKSLAHTRLFVGRVSPLGGLLLVEPLAALW